MAKGIKEKRGLFEMIFQTKSQPQQQSETFLQMLNSYDPYFSTISDNLYDNKVARLCIDRIATHCAKLIPRHIQGQTNNFINGDINFILQNRPNPLMSTYDFIYKIISILYTDSNSFVYIQKDKQGYITAFYPVLAKNYELLQDSSNRTYLQFQFVNGKIYTLPYQELIHLRLFYNKHDIYGESSGLLKPDLETALASSEGIKNAIKTSNNLKGILKFTNSMMKEKDIKANKDAFVRDFLSLENRSGIAGLDAKAEFQPVKLEPITLNKDQLEQVNKNIYDYFGLSEEIVRNIFTPEQWYAFYEGVIEPRAIQMSDEFTAKIFSDKAIKEGHKIIFTTNRIQYLSPKDKREILQTVLPYGLLTKDEALEILDLPPKGGEEGAKILQSLNNIDTTIANQYQGGGDE